jgi:hypothetical protein
VGMNDWEEQNLFAICSQLGTYEKSAGGKRVFVKGSETIGKFFYISLLKTRKILIFCVNKFFFEFPSLSSKGIKINSIKNRGIIVT